VNYVDKFGRTPLYEAALRRHKDIVMELRRTGGLIKAPYDEITNLLLRCGKENDV
jgi:ankyrin repeat protein